MLFTHPPTKAESIGTNSGQAHQLGKPWIMIGDVGEKGNTGSCANGLGYER